MKRKSVWQALAVVLFVIWLFAVLAAFYAVQKPFTTETARALMRVTLDIAVAGLITLMGAALGRRMLLWLGLGSIGRGDQVWLAPGLGLGALGLIHFFLGLAGGWQRPITCAVAAVIAVVLTRDALAWVRQVCTWRPQPALGRWGRRYLLTTLILTLLLALAPPTSWDALSYHLKGPAIFIDQGAVTPLDVDIFPLSYPSLMETLFSLAMLLRGDIAAKLIHLVYGLLLAGLMYRLSQRWQGREMAGWSLLLLGAIPMVAILAARAYNDLALAFYQVAALYALLTWQQRNHWEWLLAAGILSGFALGLKYTSFLLPLFALGYVLWHARDRWQSAAAYSLLTGLTSAPWYVRNWAFMGNPVYPFVFSGRNWDAFRSTWYAHAGTGIGLHPLRILALPATVTLGIQDVNYYDGSIGPLFLALAPSLVWLIVRSWFEYGSRMSNRERHLFLLLGGFSALQAAAWTVGVIQSRPLFQARLLLPGLVALIPLMSEGLVQLVQLDSTRFSLSAFVRMTFSVVLALNVVGQGLRVLSFDPLGYFVGYESRQGYLSRVLGDYYRALEGLEKSVPEDGKVLLLWEPRSYYSPRQAQPDLILDNWAHLRHRLGMEAGIAEHLRAEGYTHVLLYRRGLDYVIDENESQLSAKDLEQFDVFVDRELKQVKTSGIYHLYELRN